MKNFNENWIDLLTNGGKLDKQREFEGVLANSKNTMFAIMEYRRLLRSRGRGQGITIKQLQICNVSEEEVLQEVLQELFLEPIPISHISFFYENASKKYDNMMEAMKELYLRHKKDENKRFLNIVLTI